MSMLWRASDGNGLWFTFILLFHPNLPESQEKVFLRCLLQTTGSCSMIFNITTHSWIFSIYHHIQCGASPLYLNVIRVMLATVRWRLMKIIYICDLQTAYIYISCNTVYSDSQVAVMLVMVYEHQLASSSMSQCSPAFKRSSSSDFYNVKVGIRINL